MLSGVRIALDGSDLAADRFEGPSVYAGELLPRLTRLLQARDHAVTTYLPGAPRDLALAGELRVIPGQPFWTQRVLAHALRLDPPDTLFLPIQMLPLWRPRRMRTVAVVHDLEFLRYPSTYTLKNRMLLRWFTRDAVRHATKLVAVSQYTKDDVARVYGRAAEDITVVHHGVDHALFSDRVGPQDEDVRRRSALPPRFILFVGSLQPRKNLAGLVSAYEELANMPQSSTPLPHLVVVSGGAWKETSIRQRVDRSPRRADIHVIRRVVRADLPAFYRAADVFVLPSFSEGFGMPVLEAMACGTPVVTSRTSSLPEVAGDAALFVDPSDVSSIARALSELLQSRQLRDALVAKGRARARQFSWDRSAELTGAVIEAAGQG